jgi:glutamate racemase
LKKRSKNFIPSQTDWYDQIEKPVRELVRLLRNNGFNTTSSCGHEMWIQMEWYGFEEEARKLYNLLGQNGYNNFELRLFWPSSGIGQFMEVKILETN